MIRINLLGHETAKPKRRAMPEFSVGGSENAPFILAVVATGVLIAAAWWLQARSLSQLQVSHRAETAVQVELADTALRVADLEDRRAIVNQKLGVIVDLKKSQSGPVLLLDQVSEQLSDSVWLTDLTLSGANVVVVGQALSNLAVADFVENLRLSSFFADTDLDFTQDAENSVNFQLATRFVPLSAPDIAAPGRGVAAPGNGR